MKAARPDTWMPLYWGDYLRDTMHLSAAEHGAYLLLIGHYWTSGQPLPDDDSRLSRIARMTAREWKSARETVSGFFVAEAGLWRHGRIDAELAKASSITDAKAEAGRKGAAKRWQKGSSRDDTEDGAAIAEPLANVSQTDAPSPSQPPSTPPKSPKGDYAFEGKVIRLKADDFERWRTAYPNLDLRAELTALDDWYSENLDDDGRKKWFQRCSSALAKKNAERKRPAEDRGGGKLGSELTDEERLAQENYIRGCNGKPPKLPNGAIDWDSPPVTEMPPHMRAGGLGDQSHLDIPLGSLAHERRRKPRPPAEGRGRPCRPRSSRPP